MATIYRVVELDDGSLGKVKVTKTPKGWTPKDYLKFGAAAILPIAGTAAGLFLADRMLEREMRTADLGDNMFGSGITKRKSGVVPKPILTPAQKQKYVSESDTELSGVPVSWSDAQVGGSLDDLISWGKSNKKKLAAAGITLAALAALKAMTNPENYSNYSSPNVVDVYGESMVQPDFSSLYGNGLYAEARRTQQTGSGILNWARNNPKAALTLGLGGLLSIGVPLASEATGAYMTNKVSKPGYLWENR
jgi:hypothetical protein